MSFVLLFKAVQMKLLKMVGQKIEEIVLGQKVSNPNKELIETLLSKINPEIKIRKQFDL